MWWIFELQHGNIGSLFFYIWYQNKWNLILYWTSPYSWGSHRLQVHVSDLFVGSCVKCSQESGVVRRTEKLFFIVHVCSRTVWMRMFCPAWSIVSLCRYRRWSPILGFWVVLFAVRTGRMRASFVVWGTEWRLVSCVCSMRFITEWTTLWMTIWIILLQLVMLKLWPL